MVVPTMKAVGILGASLILRPFLFRSGDRRGILGHIVLQRRTASHQQREDLKRIATRGPKVWRATALFAIFAYPTREKRRKKRSYLPNMRYKRDKQMRV